MRAPSIILGEAALSDWLDPNPPPTPIPPADVVVMLVIFIGLIIGTALI
jgi:hypothetical protein